VSCSANVLPEWRFSSTSRSAGSSPGSDCMPESCYCLLVSAAHCCQPGCPPTGLAPDDPALWLFAAARRCLAETSVEQAPLRRSRCCFVSRGTISLVQLALYERTVFIVYQTQVRDSRLLDRLARFSTFYRAMLCISAVFAVMRCLCVCLSVCLSVCHVRELRQNE